MRAVMNNSRTEPVGQRTMADATRDEKAAKSPSGDLIQDIGKPEEDEYGEFPFSAEDAEKLAGKIDLPKFQSTPYPETPRKAIKTDFFLTPASKRKRDENPLPTPNTHNTNDEDVFTTSSTGRLKGSMWDGNERVGLRSPSATPTPSRFRDASEAEDLTDEKSKNESDITEEVMELLRDQQIDEDTNASLRELLGKHVLRISGIAKGRDITRVALKAKDVKIAELQQKISALEGEREMDRTVIRHFKSDMAESIVSRHGKSRGRGKS